MKQPSTTNATVKGGFNMDSLSYDPSFKMIQDLISKAEIKIKAEQDPKKVKHTVHWLLISAVQKRLT